MENDIVIRLRGFWQPNDTHSGLRDEAADEIERLRKELQEAEKLVDEYQRENADRTRWENS
jgi:hypothetical protein